MEGSILDGVDLGANTALDLTDIARLIDRIGRTDREIKVRCTNIPIVGGSDLHTDSCGGFNGERKAVWGEGVEVAKGRSFNADLTRVETLEPAGTEATFIGDIVRAGLEYAGPIQGIVGIDPEYTAPIEDIVRVGFKDSTFIGSTTGKGFEYWKGNFY